MVTLKAKESGWTAWKHLKNSHWAATVQQFISVGEFSLAFQNVL
jgi:hypothetical protein